MKKIVIGMLGLVFFVLINGCSRNTEEPQFRISNKQSSKVTVKIQTTGNEESFIKEVEPGLTTEFQAVTVGNITATSVNQNESISFLAVKKTNYTIVISTGKPPSLHVDQ